MTDDAAAADLRRSYISIPHKVTHRQTEQQSPHHFRLPPQLTDNPFISPQTTRLISATRQQHYSNPRRAFCSNNLSVDLINQQVAINSHNGTT